MNAFTENMRRDLLPRLQNAIRDYPDQSELCGDAAYEIRVLRIALRELMDETRRSGDHESDAYRLGAQLLKGL